MKSQNVSLSGVAGQGRGHQVESPRKLSQREAYTPWERSNQTVSSIL